MEKKKKRTPFCDEEKDCPPSTSTDTIFKGNITLSSNPSSKNATYILRC